MEGFFDRSLSFEEHAANASKTEAEKEKNSKLLTLLSGPQIFPVIANDSPLHLRGGGSSDDEEMGEAPTDAAAMDAEATNTTLGEAMAVVAEQRTQEMIDQIVSEDLQATVEFKDMSVVHFKYDGGLGTPLNASGFVKKKTLKDGVLTYGIRRLENNKSVSGALLERRHDEVTLYREPKYLKGDKVTCTIDVEDGEDRIVKGVITSILDFDFAGGYVPSVVA